MNHKRGRAGGLLMATLAWWAIAGAAQAVDASGPGFVAGLKPYQRPLGAPAIGSFAPDPAWRARALTGISAPVPANLRFLDDQGAWHTPFNHPGPPGYYDIRNWHGATTPTKAKPGR